jgi:hypothetical protein
LGDSTARLPNIETETAQLGRRRGSGDGDAVSELTHALAELQGGENEQVMI